WIVGTPGVLDSSVTIPGLSTVLIEDQRIEMHPTGQHGCQKIVRKHHLNMHMAQMIRRVGRQERTDGGQDEVYIFSARDCTQFADLSSVQYETLGGHNRHANIENCMLESILFDKDFDTLDSNMPSDFPHEHEEKTRQRLLKDGAIEVDDTTLTGYRLTEKGMTIVSLPFEYHWSLAVVDAPDEIRMFVALAACFGPLPNYRDHELKYNVKMDPTSDLIAKIKLGIQYIDAGSDHKQRKLAEQLGLSFRRMESVQSLFKLACDALDEDGTDYIENSFLLDYAKDELLKYFGHVAEGDRIKNLTKTNLTKVNFC
ncbi:MAG: hypothetical protein U9M89_01830, partial [Patescibacteria group bacterium]|nr:hypothetical protein [Patescibacteria group bacterium]